MSERRFSQLDQYLTFYLGDQVFALDIAMVREILDDTDITRVPRTPDFLRGVMNVRGNAVAVVDLRMKFGMSRTEMTVNTCVIITEIVIDDETTIIGALADMVQEVLEMRPEQIDAPPKMGAAIDSKFILGMGKQNDKFVIILDVAQLFSDEELAIMNHSAK